MFGLPEMRRGIPPAFGLFGLAIAYVTIFTAFFVQLPYQDDIRNVSIVMGVVWFLVGMIGHRVPIKVPAAIAILMAFQAWGALSVFFAGYEIGRVRGFNWTDWFLLRYLVLFFQCAMLVQVMPSARRSLFKFLMTMATVIAVTTILHFLRVPPFAAYGDKLQLSTFGWLHGRPSGIMTIHGHVAIICNTLAGVLCAILFVRPMRRIEIAAFFLLTFTAFIAQARTHLPALFIIGLVFLVGTWIRDRKVGLVITVVLFTLLGGITVFASDKLGYILKSDNRNLRYRQEIAWKQTDLATFNLPITGLGPEPKFFGDLVHGRPDKWSGYKGAIDNGYYLVVGSYGFVGLCMIVLMFVTGITGAVGVIRNHELSHAQRICAGGTLLAIIGVMIGMLGNNVISWQHAMTVFFTISAMGSTAAYREVRLKRLVPEGAQAPISLTRGLKGGQRPTPLR